MKNSKLAKIFKWKNILTGLSVLVFVVCVLEGTVYYKNASDSLFARIMLNIQNAVQAFFMSTEIKTSDVVKELGTELTMYERALAYLYLAMVVLAPLCTAAAIISFVKSIWYRMLTAVKTFRKKKRVIICGYNSAAERLISSVQKSSSLPVVLFAKEEITKEQRLELEKKNVRIVDFRDNSKAQDICRQYRAEEAAYMLLMHPKTTDNFSSFLELDTYISGCLPGKSYSIPCYLFIDNSIREVIDAYYDEREAATADGGLHLDLHILHVKELQARQMFLKKPIYTWNLESRKCSPQFYSSYEENAENPWNVHMLIAGFGELGQSVLLEAVTQSVMHPNSRIIIDIADHRMEEQFLRFSKRFSTSIKECLEQNVVLDGMNVRYRIRLDGASVPGGGSLDGLLELRFHNTDINYENFEQLLEDISDESPLTYCAVCFKDVLESIAAATGVEKVLRNRNNVDVPMVLVSNRRERILDYLHKNDRQFKNIFVMDEEGGFLDIDRIIACEEERRAKEFNYKYNMLSGNMKPKDTGLNTASDNEEMDRQWRKMPVFKRNSSRAMSSHGNIKKMLLANTPKLSMKEVEDVFAIENNEKNAEYINSIPMLKSFSMLEHRRWCYYMIMNGYSYTDGDKNDDLKVNPCILSWKDLCVKKPEYCRYDIAAFLPEMDNVID